jgi:hypothetical protein
MIVKVTQRERYLYHGVEENSVFGRSCSGRNVPKLSRLCPRPPSSSEESSIIRREDRIITSLSSVLYSWRSPLASSSATPGA